MANPQPDKFTRISNELLEALAKIRISGEARQVFDVMIRKIYGFQKKKDAIALSQFILATGLKKVAVCKAINKLLDMNLVTKKGNAIAFEYAINKDFDTWKPLPKKVTLPKKVITVTKKGNLPLPKKDTTKETITKEKKDKVEITDNFPDNINCPEFAEVWSEWKTHLKELKSKTTQSAFKKQLKKLSSFGLKKAIHTLNYCIEKSYRGIYEDMKYAETNNLSKTDEEYFNWITSPEKEAQIEQREREIEEYLANQKQEEDGACQK